MEGIIDKENERAPQVLCPAGQHGEKSGTSCP